jgi:hypothetical protein
MCGAGGGAKLPGLLAFVCGNKEEGVPIARQRKVGSTPIRSRSDLLWGVVLVVADANSPANVLVVVAGAMELEALLTVPQLVLLPSVPMASEGDGRRQGSIGVSLSGRLESSNSASSYLSASWKQTPSSGLSSSCLISTIGSATTFGSVTYRPQ